jgi:hypothetical protein
VQVHVKTADQHEDQQNDSGKKNGTCHEKISFQFKGNVARAVEYGSGTLENEQFRRQQVERHVAIDRQPTQPLCELPKHEARRDRRRVNGRLGGGVGPTRREEGRVV